MNAKESKYPLDPGYFKVDGKYLQGNDEYRKIIGMLLYITTHSRPDIASSVSILSQKVSNPRDVDLLEAKRVVKYLKGTRNLSLSMSGQIPGEKMFAVSDSDWAEDQTDRKSHSGFFCSVNGGAISWYCRKQQLVSTSSCEAEYIALSEASKEIVWIKRLAHELSIDTPKTITLFTDSQSAISMISNHKFSNRTKHIDTKYHHIRDMTEKKEIKLEYIRTDENIADMLTKPLGGVKLEKLRELGGLIKLN